MRLSYTDQFHSTFQSSPRRTDRCNYFFHFGKWLRLNIYARGSSFLLQKIKTNAQNGLVEQLKDKFPSAVTYIQFPFYAHLNVPFPISKSKFNIRQLSSNVRQKSYDGRHSIESYSKGCIL